MKQAPVVVHRRQAFADDRHLQGLAGADTVPGQERQVRGVEAVYDHPGFGGPARRCQADGEGGHDWRKSGSHEQPDNQGHRHSGPWLKVDVVGKLAAGRIDVSKNSWNDITPCRLMVVTSNPARLMPRRPPFWTAPVRLS
ncbi:MAG: hypothetical protein ACT7A5_30065 [Ferrovibrionaceae bacterium]